jgi:hypothetical protein
VTLPPLVVFTAKAHGPLIFELRITTLAAAISRQPVVFPSMTVPAVVMRDGPEYAVNDTPAGTPVLPGCM